MGLYLTRGSGFPRQVLTHYISSPAFSPPVCCGLNPMGGGAPRAWGCRSEAGSVPPRAQILTTQALQALPTAALSPAWLSLTF